MAKINTVFSLTDNISAGLKKIQGGMKSVGEETKKASSAALSFKSIKGHYDSIKNSVMSIYSAVSQLTEVYAIQQQAETKLETVMRQRMNASDASIQSLKEYASEMQNVGIYGDEMILNGMQELATFAGSEAAIKTLTPAMANLVAQQYGYNASAESMRSAATMIGKVLDGNTSGLSRLGYTFSEAEQRMLEYGTEEERAAVLAQIITNNVGNMNAALASTPRGVIQQVKNELGDMDEELGRVVISIQARFMQLFLKVKQVMTRLISSLIQGFKNFLSSATRVINSVIVLLGGIVAVIGIMIVKFGMLAAQAVATGVQMLIAGAKAFAAWVLALGPIGLIILIVVAIITGLALLVTALLNTGDKFEQVFRTIGKIVGAIWAGIQNEWKFVINRIIDGLNAILRAYNKVREFLAEHLDINLPTAPQIQHLSYASFRETMDNVSNSMGNWAHGVQEGFNDLKAKAQGVLDKLGFDEKMGGMGTFDNSMLEGFENIDTGIVLQEAGVSPDVLQSAGMQNMENMNFDSGGALKTSDETFVDLSEDFRELLSRHASRMFDLTFAQVTPQIVIEHQNNYGDEAGEKTGNSLLGLIRSVVNSDMYF